MSESQLINDVLGRLHDLFRSCLNFQSISPQLRKYKLLTDREWQVINNKDTQDDQVDEFLKYLPLKGKDCLNRLSQCLRSSLDHSGHQDILTKLEAELEIKDQVSYVSCVAMCPLMPAIPAKIVYYRYCRHTSLKCSGGSRNF